MYVGQDFDPMEPGEVDSFAFEFTRDLPAGQALLSVAFACSVRQTDPGAVPDAAPASRLLGAPGILTELNPITGELRTFAAQDIGGLVDGNVYVVGVTVSTSDGRTLSSHSHVRCRSPR